MTKKEIIIAGVGGQGIVSAGGMLAEAAAIFEHHEALMGCAYGSEARGTFTKSEVIIDDKRIAFPEVQKADIVVVLHQIAYDRYADKLGSGTKLLYDSDCITPRNSEARQIGVPISSLALQAGASGSQNMIALGILSAYEGIVGIEPLEKLIDKKFAAKPKVAERNKNALKIGRQAAESSPV